MAQVDLHARNSAADLLGLADEVIALMRNVLQKRADAHLVVGIGALERRDFIGDEGFKFARACDGTLDAVAHRRDFAADRLAHGDHRIACRALGLGETDRDLRHQFRDHPQFLAAPGKTCQEIEQQHGCEKQRGETGQHQRAAAALADRGLQRGKEADGQKSGAQQPDAGKQGGERVDVAGRAAFLERLQKLADGFAIVIGRAARRALLFDRLECRTVGRRAEVERSVVIRRGCGLLGGRRIAAHRRPAGIDGYIADIESFLNGRKRDLGRIFDLLWVVRHVQPKPSFTRPR